MGRSGQVGTALAQRLGRVTMPSRSEFDLSTMTRETARRLVENTAPAAIINCAAFTAVDRAEDEVELANTINGKAVGILAEIAAEARIPLVTYSTDYVFDGQGSRPYVESSEPNPINSYGLSKLIGERLALNANPMTLVIRTSWVISGTHPNFVETMVRLVSEGRSLNVVNDQQGCPTIADDLAIATLQALERSTRGILHLTNQGVTTWFDLARAAVDGAGLDPTLISPCATADYPTPAPRPAYSVLASERLEMIGMPPLPPWRDSLPPLIEQLASGHR